jgi:hypothetical protein
VNDTATDRLLIPEGTKKIISLHIGQCGNQIGYKFWQRLALEHGIAADGVLTKADEHVEDRTSAFLRQTMDGTFDNS